MKSSISDVKVIPFPTVQAARGNLTALELPLIIPFEVKRLFLVHHVSNNEIRGEHAHKQCWQVLIAVAGSVEVEVYDGYSKQKFKLDSPDKGLLIPPMIWGTQFNYSEFGVLLVLASHEFDPDDYIHNVQEFKNLKS